MTTATTLDILRLSTNHRARWDRVDAADASRPIAALEAALGLSLPAPIGSLNQRAFVFLVGAEAPVGATSLAALPDDAWALYVHTMLGGWEPPSRDVAVFFFGDGPLMAATLAHLVKCGRKRATAGWIRAASIEGEEVPSAGLISIVTDGFGAPQCAIRTTEVRVLPFGEVDAALAAEEGEGDQTLADWREGHLDFFHRQAARLGLSFDEREALFVERFELLCCFGGGARSIALATAPS